MIPIETLKEKNSWLIASSRISKKALDRQSGKDPASDRPSVPADRCALCRLHPCMDSVREKTAIPMISKISPGMMIRENFSMPFSTPRYTIQCGQRTERSA